MEPDDPTHEYDPTPSPPPESGPEDDTATADDVLEKHVPAPVDTMTPPDEEAPA
jgi:hypothetical protein